MGTTSTVHCVFLTQTTQHYAHRSQDTLIDAANVVRSRWTCRWLQGSRLVQLVLRLGCDAAARHGSSGIRTACSFTGLVGGNAFVLQAWVPVAARYFVNDFLLDQYLGSFALVRMRYEAGEPSFLHSCR